MGLTKACFATATPSLHKPLLVTPKYQNYYITLQHNKKTIYTLLGIIPLCKQPTDYKSAGAESVESEQLRVVANYGKIDNTN